MFAITGNSIRYRYVINDERYLIVHAGLSELEEMIKLVETL